MEKWEIGTAKEINNLFAAAVVKDPHIINGFFPTLSIWDIVDIIEKHKPAYPESIDQLKGYQEYLDEKIRSDKVLEGLLKDIGESLETIAASK